MLDKIMKIELNGFKQKIHIKGNKELPILLFLHGGPGVANRHMCAKLNQDLLEHFLVVGWDQRGTGGSYWGCDPKTLSIDQLTDDAEALVEYLCKEFNKDKIFVIGGSWGSLLAFKLAYKYPEHLYAIVGFGQFVDGELNEKLSYEFALNEARKANDLESVKKLEDLGAPIMGVYKGGYDGMLIEREVMNKYGGYSKKNQAKSYTSGLVKAYLKSFEYTPSDLLGIIKGNRLSLDNMWAEIGKTKLQKECVEFKIPVFIFDGKLDKNTPSDLVEDYFNSISSPHKELIWFLESGHNPLIDESEKFKSLLCDRLYKVMENKI